jgi:hypothetical protein
MKELLNHLDQKNCNKAKCKTCIFHTNGKALPLQPGRLEEIKRYLIGQYSHLCHTTDKTCYGALEYQAEMFHRLGVISDPTVECLLNTAKQILNL